MVVIFTHREEKLPRFNEGYLIIIVTVALEGVINEFAKKLVLLDILF
jgi:hypothetical protein